MKRLAVVVGLVAVLGGLTACGATTTGQPSATTTAGGGGPTAGSGSPSTTSGGGGAGLPVDAPCSLVSTSDLAQLGVSAAPQTGAVGTAHTCDFDSADFSMGIAIRTNGGLDAFNNPGGTPQQVTVGKHQAKRELDNTGSCTVAIGVSASSRVDVTVTPILNGEPCAPAMRLATIVEQKLS